MLQKGKPLTNNHLEIDGMDWDPGAREQNLGLQCFALLELGHLE